MPSKYVIHTKQTNHRFEPLSKSGVIAWEEGCLKCAVCVKKECVYGVYDKRNLNPGQMIDSIDNKCMNCLRCVQNCPKQLIQKSINPLFKEMGDTYWTPDIIARLWYQGETGKIPVSGAGYPGPFSGPGFDSMWTDMSEIVRPTRDGIHGREYISTGVDIGRTPKNLVFDKDGRMIKNDSAMIDIPLPIIIRVPDFGSISDNTIRGWISAAKRLDTFLAIPVKRIIPDFLKLSPYIIPVISSDDMDGLERNDHIRMVEYIWDENGEGNIEKLTKLFPSAIISARLYLAGELKNNITKILETGCPVINLEGSYNGKVKDDDTKYLKEEIRELHLFLVDEGLRDQVTLIASGGFSMAEHVAKAILCGADAVYVDFPVLIALECRMCHRCEQNLACPVEIENASIKWVTSRTINIIGAWHNQLLEVMGAMGIRDVRRLRGEVGRAMFFEELDKNIFGSLNRIEGGVELE
jgi:ferredoxin